MEVEKDHFLSINGHAAIPVTEPIIFYIPKREIGALVCQYHYARKTIRPFVEVFLIREPISLQAVVTPFDAALPPPFQTGEPIQIATKANETYIVTAIDLLRPNRGGIAMLENRDRVSPQLVEQGFDAGKKRQVGIKIGDHLTLTQPLEGIKRQA